MGITVPSLYTIFADFRTYPVTTKSVMEDRSSALFPAVTFCGLNRIHCWNLYTTMTDMKKAVDQGSGQNPAYYTATNLAILEDIFNKTKCVIPICSALDDTFTREVIVWRTIRSTYVFYVGYVPLIGTIRFFPRQ